MRVSPLPLRVPAALLVLLVGCGSADDATTTATKTTSTATTSQGGSGQGGGAQGGAAQGGGAQGGSGQGGVPNQDVAPSVISESGKTFIEAETSVAAGPNGFVVVAYIAMEMSGSSVNGYRFSTDGGHTWSEASFLASPAGRVASDPVLVFDHAGNAWMSWVGYRINQQGASDMHVYVARADAGTTKFGAPIEVSDPKAGTQLDKPWIVVTPKGSLLVTYAETSTGAAYAARSDDGGATWKRSQVEAGVTAFSNLLYPCASAETGRVYVAYIHASNMGGGVRLRWSDDDGASWSLANKTDVLAADDSPAFEDPTCAATANEVWVSYGVSSEQFGSQQSAKLDGVRVAHSANGGHAIDRRSDALDGAASTFAMHPQMIRETDGGFEIVYYAGSKSDDPKGSFRRVRSTDGALTWSPSVSVMEPLAFVPSRSDQRWLGDYTGIAWLDGSLYTSFVDNTSGTSHIAFARVAPH